MKKQKEKIMTYSPEPTLKQFHESRNMFRVVFGPVGSGKTSAACNQIMREMMAMPAQADGVRRSAYLFFRDTEGHLRDTTMKTWMGWYGGVSTLFTAQGNMRIEVKADLPDGTSIESTIYCKPQRLPDDAEDLKSLELTGFFGNEVSNVPWQCVQMAIARTGRYPSKEDMKGVPYRVSGIMDTNMPDDFHWLYRLSQVKKPLGWEFFFQPPAMFAEEQVDGTFKYIPNRGQKLSQGILPAENVSHLIEGWSYYHKQVNGNDHDWNKVNVMCEWGTIKAGKPVYSGYADRVHYVDGPIAFEPSKVLMLAFDYGLDVCCAIMQMSQNGQVRVLEEVITEEQMGIERFWNSTLRPLLINDYGYGKGTKVWAVGDPAGTQRSQVDESTCKSFLISKGLDIVSCLTNNPKVRRDSVDYFLRRTADAGQPAFALSNKCPISRKGFSGWYFFKRVKQHLDEVYTDTPAKNSFSHIQDAEQYGCHVFKNPDLYDFDFRAGGTDQFGDRINDTTTLINANGGANLGGV